MADQGAALDDVTPDVLQQDYLSTLAITIADWRESPAAGEVAIGAALSSEAAELYSLVQEDATDSSRDYGAKVERVPPLDAFPANSATTWVASDTAGYTIPAGTLLTIVGGPDIEVVIDAVIPPGETTITGVIVNADPAGTAANGATGELQLDDPPPWLSTVTLDAPLSGGEDAESDEDYDERLSIIRYSRSDAVVSPDQVQALAVTIPGIARCLVIKGYDLDTDTADVPLQGTSVPIDAAGADASPDAVTAFSAQLADRSPDGVVMHVGTPTRNDITVAVTVAANADVDAGQLTADVQAAVAAALNPATFGPGAPGTGTTWSITARYVHIYAVSSLVSAVADVEYVDDLTLNAGHDDIAMTGIAPLPHLTAPATVTIIAPS